MQELKSDDFHQTVEAEPAIAVVFLDGAPSKDAGEPVGSEVIGSSDQWRWFFVNAVEAPQLASMFGLADKLPALLLMREQVVLFAGNLAKLSDGRLQDLLAGAGRLAMSDVHAQLAQQREGAAVIAARRICPTALRTR